MDDETLMLECIKQATLQSLSGEMAREEAKKMFNQIKGRSENYGAPQNPPKARVVGKDGDLPDYVRD